MVEDQEYIQKFVDVLLEYNLNQKQINSILEILKKDDMVGELKQIYVLHPLDEPLEIVAGNVSVKVLRYDDEQPTIVLLTTKAWYVCRYIIDVDGNVYFISESDY